MTAEDVRRERLAPRKEGPQFVRKVRRCLKCPKNFRSEGPHNHLCERCAEQNRHLDDNTGYRVISK